MDIRAKMPNALGVEVLLRTAEVIARCKSGQQFVLMRSPDGWRAFLWVSEAQDVCTYEVRELPAFPTMEEALESFICVRLYCLRPVR